MQDRVFFLENCLGFSTLCETLNPFFLELEKKEIGDDDARRQKERLVYQ